MMAKKALLIGVNIYQTPGNDLRGCVNDVLELGNVLIRHFDFDQRKIRVLTDGKAKTKSIRRDITNLIDGAKEGDVLLLHYSGHGSNVPDRNGDERDRADEILCPTDLDWKDPLLDDWLRTTFDRLPADREVPCCGVLAGLLHPPRIDQLARW